LVIQVRIMKSRELRWAGGITRAGKKMNAYTVFVGKSLGKGPGEKPRKGWEEDTKTDLRMRGGGRGPGWWLCCLWY
jgi:hypothetical protein